MSRRSSPKSTAPRQGIRILSTGAQFHAVVVVTVVSSLLYCASAQYGDAIAATEGGNQTISVQLQTPQARTVRDQPYPGLQIVARQEASRAAGPHIRPRITKPGPQKIGRARAVFTTPTLTIRRPIPQLPVRQRPSGGVTGSMCLPRDPYQDQSRKGRFPTTREMPPQAAIDRTFDADTHPIDLLLAYKTRQLVQEAEEALNSGDSAGTRSRAYQARSFASSEAPPNTSPEHPRGNTNRGTARTTNPAATSVKTVSARSFSAPRRTHNHSETAESKATSAAITPAIPVIPATAATAAPAATTATTEAVAEVVAKAVAKAVADAIAEARPPAQRTTSTDQVSSPAPVLAPEPAPARPQLPATAQAPVVSLAPVLSLSLSLASESAPAASVPKVDTRALTGKPDHGVNTEQQHLSGTSEPLFAPPVREPVNSAVPSPQLFTPNRRGAEIAKSLRLTVPIKYNQNGAIHAPPSAPRSPPAEDEFRIPTATQPPGVPQEYELPSSVPHHSFQDIEMPASKPVAQQSGSHWAHSYIGPSPGMSGYRATIENDADVWMSPYADRANQAAGSPALAAVIPALTELPPGFTPWWDATVRQSTGLAKTSMDVDVSHLLQTQCSIRHR
ncbi:MAG: hypothetical protein GY878_31590 [Fuerstiella sp.]|nr:hypothetical protein [Fuerstiella sp.]